MSASSAYRVRSGAPAKSVRSTIFLALDGFDLTTNQPSRIKMKKGKMLSFSTKVREPERALPFLKP